MEGNQKDKEAPEEGDTEEEAWSDESFGELTISDIAHLKSVKRLAVRFVSITDRVVLSDRERAIAAWAYACGMAHTIKTTEKALGASGASAVFGMFAMVFPVTKCEDGHEECAMCHQLSTAGEEFDKLEKVLILTGCKQATGRFDPMYI
jgi:hypothetical protein